MTCQLSTRPEDEGGQVEVEPRNGSAVAITVPEAGFVVYS